MMQSNASSYEIKALTADNLDELCRLEAACFEKPWTYKMFAGEFLNPAAHYSGIFFGTQLVAYLGMWYACDEGQITNVAVHPQHRRRGLAERLFQEAMQQARAVGVLQFTLEVRAHNTAAVSLYQKLGFVTVGCRKKYYENKEDALLLTLFAAAHEGENKH